MKLKEIMERAKFVKQGSKMVFVCDISDLSAEEARKVIERSKSIVEKMPKKTVLAEACLANVKHNSEVETYIQELLEHCTPHVLKAAYCNIADEKLKDALERILPSSGSNRRTFKDRDEGLNWLLDSEVE